MLTPSQVSNFGFGGPQTHSTQMIALAPMSPQAIGLMKHAMDYMRTVNNRLERLLKIHPQSSQLSTTTRLILPLIIPDLFHLKKFLAFENEVIKNQIDF